MDTEELNKYVFSKMVMEAAHSIRTKRVGAMVKAGQIAPEDGRSIEPSKNEVHAALINIRRNRKVVFDTLAELLAAETAGDTNHPG